jgi:formylglycine-generating enzyme required for sulfatase activity
MVVIPAGHFLMGSKPDPQYVQDEKDEVPQHDVRVASFAISKYEVTEAQWQAVMGKDSRTVGGPDLPVEGVSWDETQIFLQKLNAQTGRHFRLPSEAEWEFAARAGTQTIFLSGDDDSKLGDYAWFRDNSDGKPHPVGTKKPNAFGLYDMYGNVTEWAEDCYRDSYAGAPTDGSAVRDTPCKGHVLRGESWFNKSSQLRAANRNAGNLDDRTIDRGFRLAESLH